VTIGKIDLHTHTKSSDGVLETRELLTRANDLGVGVISITDHDTVASLPEARTIAGELGMEFVPGIEITSRHKNFQLHFLGYFFDYSDKRFMARLNELQNARLARAKRIVDKLNRIRIPLKLEAVLERAGVRNSVGRPHIANTMVEEGFAETYDEVFDKYIGIGRPAYEANYSFPPEEAVKMIAGAGGVTFLAHPSHYVSLDLLVKLLKIGIDGVEVIHPSHSDEEMKYYERFANENSILMSGGSDYHGGLKNDEGNLGRYGIDDSWLQKIKSKIKK